MTALSFEAWADGRCEWSQLRSRLQIPEALQAFPFPNGSAAIHLEARFDTQGGVTLRFSGTVTLPGEGFDLFGFRLAGSCKFGLSAGFASSAEAGDFLQGSDQAGGFPAGQS